VGFGNFFSSLETPDKYTLVLTSETPRPAIFDYFEYFNILDPVTMEGADAKSKAVGTGPFALQDWTPGTSLNLSKNKNYWQTGRPYLDAVEMRAKLNVDAMVVQFEAGALDGIKNPSISDYSRLKANPEISKFRASLYRDVLLHGGQRQPAAARQQTGASSVELRDQSPADCRHCLARHRPTF
jgi:ABC-type transport system substrate-binding protein